MNVDITGSLLSLNIHVSCKSSCICEKKKKKKEREERTLLCQLLTTSYDRFVERRCYRPFYLVEHVY